MANITIVATGGVRAAKHWDLALRFQADGHRVRCIVTFRALFFLIGFYARKPWRLWRFLRIWHPPFKEALGYLFHGPGSVSHINIAKWGDVILVAPATCNSLSKIVSGTTDNYAMLVIRAAARDKSVIIAPSMNPEMWFDPFTQKNIDHLNQSRKYTVVAPRRAEMRSGDVGLGAMAADDTIVETVYRSLVSREGTQTANRRHHFFPEENARVNLETKPSHLLVIGSDTEWVRELQSITQADYQNLTLVTPEKDENMRDAIDRVRPACIIVDITSPERNAGDRAIEFFFSSPASNPIPVIAVADMTRTSVAWEDLARRDIPFIPKPRNGHYLLQMAMGHLSVGRDSFN